MTSLSLWWVELRRLLCRPLTWLAVAAVAWGALSGIYITSSTTMASRYLAWQISAACLWGTPVFALLTLLELSRVQRGGMDALCDCVCSPRRLAAARLAALTAVCLLASLLLMLAYAPFAAAKLGIVFSVADYAASFLVVLFPALAFGCLVAFVCYQLTRRVEVSALLTVAFWMVSSSGLCENQYLWQWSLPFFSALSDDFSNAMVFRMAFYNRLVWLCLLGGVGLFSLLCVRRYGKGLAGSLRHGLGRPWLPALALCLVLGGVWMWRTEPFFDQSPIEWMEVKEAYRGIDGLRLMETNAEVTLHTTPLGHLEGSATLTLRNATGREQPFYFQLNSGYTVTGVTANGQTLACEDLKNDYIAARELRCTLPADEVIALTIAYGGAPRLWNIAQSTFGNGTLISGRSVNLGGKSLVPACYDLEQAAGAPYHLRLTLPGHLTPVTSGSTPKLQSRNSNGTATWLAQDVDEYRISLLAGDYIKVDLQGGGIPIEFYYSQKHKAQMERLNATQTMEAAIAFCTEHFGPRTFKEGQAFKIVQGSELIFGGFARENISSMSEDSFTAENLSDTEKGASGAEVLAHEIIHQWWGLGVMFMDPTESFWGDEGITTYTTYRLLKELRGEDYADRHYKQNWQTAVAHTANSFYARHPEYRDRLPEAYRVELDMQQRSVMMYDGYALMFCRAAELLGGEDKLDVVLSQLYRQGGTEMPPYVTLNDFLNAAGLTKEDLGLV